MYKASDFDAKPMVLLCVKRRAPSRGDAMRSARRALALAEPFFFCAPPPTTHAPCATRPPLAAHCRRLGQYSVGKTSFIRDIIGREFPGARIGPEPTTDR